MDNTETPNEDDLVCPVCGDPCHPKTETPLQAIDRELAERGGDPWRRSPGWSIELARQGHFQWACTRCIFEERAIRARPWLQQWHDLDPHYAYFDRPMRCADCRSEFVFTASEQQFWYEEKQFTLESYPKRCLSCRRRRRARKDT